MRSTFDVTASGKIMCNDHARMYTCFSHSLTAAGADGVVWPMAQASATHYCTNIDKTTYSRRHLVLGTEVILQSTSMYVIHAYCHVLRLLCTVLCIHVVQWSREVSIRFTLSDFMNENSKSADMTSRMHGAPVKI